VSKLNHFFTRSAAHSVSSRFFLLIIVFCFVCIIASQSFAQEKVKQTASSSPASSALTRATVRHENRRLGYGGTLVLRGAPVGSITIEGWQKSEVDVTADIELRGDSEEDLNRLAAVNNFLFASEPNQVSIITVGTHDRSYMKRAAKNFPKNLLNAVWKIDYRIRVPAFTNLEISNGRGAIKIEGVEGALRLEATEADASLALAGGDVAAIIQRGTLNVRILQRSWRGHGAEFNLANGELNAEFPPNFSGDINAEVLLSGKLENTFDALAPRDEEQDANSSNTAQNPRRLRARAGAGGPTLAFTVGSGTLRLRKATASAN
jgi:hypothetical protein